MLDIYNFAISLGRQKGRDSLSVSLKVSTKTVSIISLTKRPSQLFTLYPAQLDCAVHVAVEVLINNDCRVTGAHIHFALSPFGYRRNQICDLLEYRVISSYSPACTTVTLQSGSQFEHVQ